MPPNVSVCQKGGRGHRLPSWQSSTYDNCPKEWLERTESGLKVRPEPKVHRARPALRVQAHKARRDIKGHKVLRDHKVSPAPKAARGWAHRDLKDRRVHREVRVPQALEQPVLKAPRARLGRKVPKERAEAKGADRPAHRGHRAYQERKERLAPKVLPVAADRDRKDLKDHPAPKAQREVPAPAPPVRRGHKALPAWGCRGLKVRRDRQEHPAARAEARDPKARKVHRATPAWG
jgi:hypothetical protein